MAHPVTNVCLNLDAQIHCQWAVPAPPMLLPSVHNVRINALSSKLKYEPVDPQRLDVIYNQHEKPNSLASFPMACTTERWRVDTASAEGFDHEPPQEA